MNALCSRIKESVNRPVVMIGLMGAGKTRLGGMLAKALSLPFADSDKEIERASNLTVSEIFEKLGEPRFREMEEKVLTRLLSNGPCVIATGGGAVMNERTAQKIWDEAISIWLNADIDVLVRRCGRNNKRPLLAGANRADMLKSLMDVRGAVYGRADITVDTSGPDTEATFQTLLQSLANHLGVRESL